MGIKSVSRVSSLSEQFKSLPTRKSIYVPNKVLLGHVLHHHLKGIRETMSTGKNTTCVCVCFLPIHSGLQWTYQPGSHRKKVTQDFSIHLLSAVLALIFLVRRIQPFLSLVDREVEFCVLTI